MNYTRPNSDEPDTPKDWLNSALIFARTLSLILEENTGIVVKLKGDMVNPINPDSDRVVVFKKDKMVHVDDIQDQSLQEGDFIDHLIIGVEQEKPITYFKEVVEEYKLDCNPFKYRIIINSLVDDLKEYLLLW